MEWFKIYKMPDGKPANEFAFNAEPKNKEFAQKIIAGTHDSWKRMVSGQSEDGGLAASNTTLANQFSLDQEAAAGIMAEVSNSCSYNTIALLTLYLQTPELGEEHPLPDDIHKWHYVSLK